MKAISFFTGIGGFDLGLERSGIQVTDQCEIDPSCRRVLARHFPAAKIHDDIQEIALDGLAADLVCGGFPCQDLSVAGKRAGLAGDRSGLWFEFHRVVDSIAPPWILIENVPGLYSSWSPHEPPPPPVPGGTWEVDESHDFATVINGLLQLGYGLAWRCFNAEYFGVAQRRRRVFIVGCLGNPARAAKVLFEPESCAGDSPPSRKTWKEVAGCLGGGPSRIGRRSEDDPNLVMAEAVSAIQGGASRLTH